MRNRFLLFAVCVALLFIAAICRYQLAYRISAFRGDATAVDTGFWTGEYRYSFSFSKVSLDAPQEFRFDCQGLPPGRLFFGFSCIGRSKEALKRIATRVGVTITDSEGNIVLNYPLRPLSEWDTTDHYEPQSAFLFQDPPWLEASTDETYYIVVRVADVDPGVGEFSIIPFINGGGTELP